MMTKIEISKVSSNGTGTGTQMLMTELEEDSESDQTSFTEEQNNTLGG